LALADEKILSHPYQDVPTHWRRLYTDATLLKTLASLEIISTASPSPPSSSRSKLLDLVRDLDMALIVAGAPGVGRSAYIFQLISHIQTTFLKTDAAVAPSTSPTIPEATSTPPKKRQKQETNSRSPPPPAVANTSSSPGVARPIPRLDQLPSLDDFFRTYIHEPFIVIGGISHWPALNERPWRDPEYISRVAGPGRVVPVEVGGTYTQAGWGQKIIPFSEFLVEIGMKQRPSKLNNEEDKDNAEEEDEQTQDHRKQLLYLAQHDLFRQMPSLLDDIVPPDLVYTAPPVPHYMPAYAPLDTDTGYTVNAWLGPAGTVSPAHTDPYYNCYGNIIYIRYSFCRNGFDPILLSSSSSPRS
jgi:hypothetical protein